jgi:hypothetical protein
MKLDEVPVPPIHVADTQWLRAREFGVCTAALIIDPEVSGAEAMFNQALSNALVAIVTHHWPDRVHKKNGNVKSAADLLAIINSEARKQGNMRVLEGQQHGHRWRTAIATKVLAEGVRRSDPIRHGKVGGSRLELRHVDALRKLDTHPSLRKVGESLNDEHWVRMMSSDREARKRAMLYVLSLSEDEWDRRQTPSYIEEYLPFSPKEQSMSLGVAECPVCELETLVVEEIDMFGLGIASGTCRACGYTRTPDVAEDEAIAEKIAFEIDQGD